MQNEVGNLSQAYDILAEQDAFDDHDVEMMSIDRERR